MTDMEIGKRYIVTKRSDDGTFEVGDHIWKEQNGDISVREAQGWIDSENVPDATAGMEVDIDADWIAKRRARLAQELAELDKM